MKKILTLLTALTVFVSSFASSLVETPSRKASEIFVPIGKNGEKISVLDLTEIRVKDFEKVTGRNMKLTEKIAFKIAQKELRKGIEKDGTINKKKMKKFYETMASEKARGYLKLWLILLGGALVLSIIGAFVPFVWILASLAWIAGLVFFVLWLIALSQDSVSIIK